MRMIHLLLTGAAALALSACSGEAEEVAEAGGEGQEAIPEENAASEGNSEAPSEAQVEAEDVAAEEPALVSCHGGANTYCRGPVMVKVTNLVLSKLYDRGSGRADLALKATFTVENRTDSPIQFTLLTQEVTQAVLANGFTMSGNRGGQNIGGLTACRERDISQCILTQPDDFIVLQPDESPATFNVTYIERANAETMASIPRVGQTDANIQMVVSTADGASRKISAAFTGVDIFNNLAR